MLLSPPQVIEGNVVLLVRGIRNADFPRKSYSWYVRDNIDGSRNWVIVDADAGMLSYCGLLKEIGQMRMHQELSFGHECRSNQEFRKNVGDVIVGVHILHVNGVVANALSDEVVFNVNMLRGSREFPRGFNASRDDAFIVLEDGNGSFSCAKKFQNALQVNAFLGCGTCCEH